jgi:hypothetical protein
MDYYSRCCFTTRLMAAGWKARNLFPSGTKIFLFFITYHVQGDFLRRKMLLCKVSLDFNRTGFGVFFYLPHEAESFWEVCSRSTDEDSSLFHETNSALISRPASWRAFNIVVYASVWHVLHPVQIFRLLFSFLMSCMITTYLLHLILYVPLPL